jgi:hypothetical protein
MPASIPLHLSKTGKEPEMSKKRYKRRKTLQPLEELQQIGISDVESNTNHLKMLKIELFEEITQTSVLSLNGTL